MLTFTAHIMRSAVTAPRIHIDFLWMLVIVFGSVGMAYLILTFVLKRRLTRKEKKTIVLKKDIAPLLGTLLYNANDGSREEGEDVMNAKVHIKELLKNPAHRNKISEILIDIRTDLPDETRLRILRMYQDFGLHEDAIQRLQSWRWEEVCRGINELTQMQVTGAYMYIRKYINDSRSIVRKQAQLAMVALKPEGIVYFLDHAKHAISEWQQLKILETLKELPGYHPPRFRLWLTSKNQHVVLFAMRLIRSFDQDDAMESILKLVKHRDDAIKVEAIHCIREFGYREAVPLFKRIFRNCKSEVKVALLSAIGEMGEKEDIPFLHYVEQHATDHVIKSKAISTINALAPESILPSDQINDSLAEDLLILDIGPIEKRDPNPDIAHVDEGHERFQDALNAPEFIKFQGQSDENNPGYDWGSVARLNDIFVVAETLEDYKETEGPADEIEEVYATIDQGLRLPKTQKSDGPEPNTKKYSFHRILDPFDPFTIQGHNPENESESERSNSGTSQLREGVQDHDDIETAAVTPDFKLASLPYGEASNPIGQLPAWDNSGPHCFGTESDNIDFEKVFKHLSEDMKLSLLADILKLGDRRDLSFLRKLGSDRSSRVRRNARRTFEMLVLKERRDIIENCAEELHAQMGPTLEELAFEIDLELRPGLGSKKPVSKQDPAYQQPGATKQSKKQSDA